MTKVQQAESTLYAEISEIYDGVFFVGVGKQLTNEIVLVVYVNTLDDKAPYVPEDWGGFRTIIKSLDSLIS